MSAPAVHFVRGGAAYLPELQAYRGHLASLGRDVVEHADASSVPPDASVVWWICGRVPRSAPSRWPRAFHVHEYASASVPPLPRVKDGIKRAMHPKPQHRVFQNEWVRGRFGFRDGVPHTLRDMGVPRSFLEARPAGVPEFDLVYLGETSRLLAFAPTLRAIREAGLTLLVVGAVEERVRGVLGNATCTGRVPQADVPTQLLRARAGLNLVPARLPFSEQASTKALEYLAVGLPVLGNRYAWFDRAALEHPGRMFAIATEVPRAWRDSMRELPARMDDRSSLRYLAWEERLRGLPVWSALP